MITIPIWLFVLLAALSLVPIALGSVVTFYLWGYKGPAP